MGLLNRVESFQPNQNHRRSIRLGERQMRVEVVIECDACPAILSGELKNFLVISAIEAHLCYVYNIPLIQPEQRRRVRGQTLIEQDPVHAT